MNAADKLAEVLKPFIDAQVECLAGGVYDVTVNGRTLISARAALAEYEAEKAQPAPESKYSDIVSTGGMDPRNAADALAAGRADAQPADKLDAERYRELVSGHRRKWIWNHVLTDYDKMLGGNSIEDVLDVMLAARAEKGGT